MAAAASSGVGADGDRVRFTTRKVPENPSVKDRTGLPFGVLVRPHLRSDPKDGTDDGSSSADAIDRTSSPVEVIHADSIARCTECFGYVNGFCGFERDGWICSLCGTFSYWPGGRGGGETRYGRNQKGRKELPEIRMRDFEMTIAEETIQFDEKNNVGSSPVYVAMLDLTSPEDILELQISSTLAAMEAVSECVSFGVCAFDNDVWILDASGDQSVIKKVPVDVKNGSIAVPLEDLMPLDQFLVPLKTHKDKITDALEAMQSLKSSTRVMDDDKFSNGVTSSSSFSETHEGGLLRDSSRSASSTNKASQSSRSKKKQNNGVGFLSTLASPLGNKKSRGGLLDDVGDAKSSGLLSSLISKFRNVDVDDDEVLLGFNHGGETTDNADTIVGQNNTGSRAFGPALEAVLTWLGAEGVSHSGDSNLNSFSIAAAAPAHPSCRVLAFLTGAPDLGDGSVSADRRHDATSTAPSTSGYAANASFADQRMEQESDFYADAGDRAALAAVVVDVVCLAELCTGETSQLNSKRTITRGIRRGIVRAPNTADLASVAPLAERSGGALLWYKLGDFISDDPSTLPPVPRDVFRLLESERSTSSGTYSKNSFDSNSKQTGDALHCTLRIRTSSEFGVRNCFGGGIVPDETYEGLYHVPRCCETDTFAFDFTHANGAGFGKKGETPPTVQVAFEFTETKSSGEGEGNGAVTRRRIRRVCTRQASVGSTPDDVFVSMDGSVVFGVLYRKILRAAVVDGIAEARVVLTDWLVNLVAKQNKNSDGVVYLSKVVHACLAKSKALAVPFRMGKQSDWVTCDARVNSFFTENRLGPDALVRTMYPDVVAFGADALGASQNGAVENVSIRASRRSLITSNGSVFISDLYDEIVVFYAPSQPGTQSASLPYPPPRNSVVQRAVDRLRSERLKTPTVVYVRGGVENPSPFDSTLVEETDVTLLVSGETSEISEIQITGGFEGFMRFLEDKARALVEEGV